VSTALQRRAYTVFAPWYDLAIESATRQARGESLKRLRPGRDVDLLLCGAGSGLDIPHLPAGAMTTALDLTPAMLHRAQRRASRDSHTVFFVVGDATAITRHSPGLHH